MCMWYEDCLFYQIYPLGFCGAPQQNDGIPASRLGKIAEWIPHMQKLGVGAVLLNPLFESDAHGYDTRSFEKVDCRLGTNEDFAHLCCQLHAAGIKVVLDGVFNHVGRGFWAFQDVLQNRENSPYRDWFYIDFGRDNQYGDGLWYEGWEGHYELVKLNLANYMLVDKITARVGQWIDDFGVDGLRLDVAYSLDEGLLRHLHSFCTQRDPSFFLVGEILHGDYKRIVAPGMLQSATNYECYKGMYSSLNSMNMFEIAYSYNRQFGPDEWTLYKDLPLFNFVDNHDVTRAASILDNERHLPLLYGMLFGMPGVPCLYYGSEWGEKGVKEAGSDASLRPAFGAPQENDLSRLLQKMAAARAGSAALRRGSYRQVYLTNHQFIFERAFEGSRVLVALNAADAEHHAHFDAGAGRATDLLTGSAADFGGGLRLAPCSIAFLGDLY